MRILRCCNTISAPAIMAVIVVLVGCAGLAASADSKEQTAAFIDIDHTPLGALLESKLLESKSFRWVDRSQIDAVLKEQALASAFAAEHVGQRVRLGKMLKANVLILLRRDAQSSGHELVICETEQGLRLLNRRIGTGKELEQEANLLAALVQQTGDRWKEPVEAIFAVPPFFSDDLEHDYDYSKREYARLLEEHLARRPRTLVVEIREAEAIAKEIALTAPGKQVRRPLPFYVLGSYRNEGQDAQRATKVKLELRHGERQLAAFASDPVLPADVARTLLQALNQQLARANVGESATTNPAVEARLALERAKAFQKIGDYEEYAALVEVAFLLQPDNVELQREAVEAYLRRFNHYYEQKDKAGAVASYFRAAEILEAVLEADLQRPKEERTHWGLGHGLRSVVYDCVRHRPFSTEAGLLLEELPRIRQTLLRIARLKHKGEWGNAGEFLGTAVQGLPLEEKCRIVLQSILELQEVPCQSGIFAMFALHSFTFDETDSSEVRQLVADLRRLGNDRTKQVAERLEDKIAATIEYRAKREAARATSKFTAENFLQRVVVLQPGEVQPIPLATDAFWLAIPGLGDLIFDRSLDLMTEKGRITTLWRPEINQHITTACCDGEFIWVQVLADAPDSYLLLIDPVTRQHRIIGSEEGLPSTDGENNGGRNYTVLAPLGRGRICAASTFGRTWIAIITANLVSAPAIKVFHEARELIGSFDGEAWQSTNSAFIPGWMRTFSREKESARLLLGRHANGAGRLHEHPLIIDPEAATVSVVQKLTFAFNFQGREWHDYTPSAVIACGKLGKAGPHGIVRLGYPTFEPEIIKRNTPLGAVVIAPGHLHLIGKSWWVARFDGEKVLDDKFTLVAEKLPWSDLGIPFDVNRSLHYGVVVNGYAPREMPTLPTLPAATLSSD